MRVQKAAICLLLVLEQTHAFDVAGPSRQKQSSWTTLEMSAGTSNRPKTSRRHLLSNLAAITSLFLVPTEEAQGKNDDVLFRPNPLTNPVLEQLRIWEQAEADELRYGGELERGDAGNKGQVQAYPKLLVPILQISRDLQQIDSNVHDPTHWKDALSTLRQEKYQKIAFKKIFNAYGDNIYYSDPDRANVYLGGGATPRSEQSMAYLLRNEVLTSVEALQAELEYLTKASTPLSDKEDTTDLYQYAREANTSMQKYMALVPPNELKAANEILLSTNNQK